MISGENIQQYINFLHEKRYAAPADEELLNRWKSLNDFEIIQQLQGLYNFWGIDNMTAAMYERLFIQAQNIAAPVTEVPVAPEYPEAVKTKKRIPPAAIIAGLIIIFIAIGIIWFWARTSSLSKTNTDLQKKMQQVKDSVSQAEAIRLQQEREAKRQAYEKAQKIKAVKDNIGMFVTQKVTYDYDGFFGGIDNVLVTVSNNSDFNMNAITVQLSYIKKNGELYDTKYLTVRDVAAHSQKMVKGPDSKRGMKVNSKISHVQSDELEPPE